MPSVRCHSTNESQRCSVRYIRLISHRFPFHRQGQPPTLDPRVIQRPSSWTLEEDDDVRGLLDKTIGNAHNTRSIMVGPVFTDVAGPSVQTRPASSQPYGRSGSRARSAQGAPAFTGYKGGARRPQTAAGVRRETTLDAKEYGRSDIVQLRREMLIRSHGQGNNLDTFAAQPFQATAMGRRARYGRALDRSEVMIIQGTSRRRVCGDTICSEVVLPPQCFTAAVSTIDTQGGNITELLEFRMTSILQMDQYIYVTPVPDRWVVSLPISFTLF